MPVATAFGGDAGGPVFWARGRVRVGIMAVRSAQGSGLGADAAGASPVGVHKPGNTSALPGVVT
ncbi:hypothetical protein MMAN_34650 [Mycobacterium mantenii]|uniref:Uncharacterized protein n=1 Tax=Mycobacterium mantenii TaxID=560555 RepID=A0A1X0FWH3_MYCNT|nr:hypothetical protein [Mycobacterium mantenii]ORB06141.1 hypothetical protein BST30_11260 [Mycobacterium mantenii]BBY39331.1 hypothetical protein MMAN_34650 [Mycobacterium mantenii]